MMVFQQHGEGAKLQPAMMGARMKFAALAAFLSVVTWTSGAAVASVVAECGASNGVTYSFEDGFVAPGHGGWVRDGFAKGRMFLTLEGDRVDIQYEDLPGMRRSHAATGARVWLSSSDKSTGTYLVMVENPAISSVEHYLFRLNKFGVGTVVWGRARAAGVFVQSMLMVAQCQPP